MKCHMKEPLVCKDILNSEELARVRYYVE